MHSLIFVWLFTCFEISSLFAENLSEFQQTLYNKYHIRYLQWTTEGAMSFGRYVLTTFMKLRRIGHCGTDMSGQLMKWYCLNSRASAPCKEYDTFCRVL